MAEQNEEILRESFMTKRSQNRSRFGPTNWKERWFVLTPFHLIYFDGDRNSGRRREKGRVELHLVEAVEKVDTKVFTRDFIFQLTHSCEGEPLVLYISANSATEQEHWLEHLRTLVADNDCLAPSVHFGALIRNQWTCCKGNKESEPCQTVTWIPNNNILPGMWGKHMDEFNLLEAKGKTVVPDLIPNTPHHFYTTQPTQQTLPMQTNGPINSGRVCGAFIPFKRKVVVALYDYNAAQAGDLSLRKNEEFDILDDSEDHWWKMRDSQGREGYAPSNYVREKGHLGLQQYDWYLGDSSRQRAEGILMREEKEGCFVVRNSTTNSGIYTLSVFSKMSRVQVKHYHIRNDVDGMYYLSNSIKCATIPELIFRHQHNPGGLCTRLRMPPSQLRQAPTTAGLSHASRQYHGILSLDRRRSGTITTSDNEIVNKWEIGPSELTMLEELGSGQFGVVRHAKLFGMDVAVKMMKEGTMSEDEFIEEAKVMTKLQHPNLVQLYGVCRRKRPIYIVTEYLKHGSLLNYLRNKEKLLIQKTDTLLDMCMQVCDGMAYLEGQKFIHRDLAARNCLVGSNNVIKVGDFGLARYVVDDEYTGSGGAKFPIKWAAPEVLNYMRFSSKSDVWAFAVLMWEVFTCGKMPYGRHKNAEVVELVQQGKILDRPRHCPVEIYEIMRKGWMHSQEHRPGFQDIRLDILRVAKTLTD